MLNNGVFTLTIAKTAAALLGPSYSDSDVDPEYRRGVEELARDLAGYTDDGDAALNQMRDLIATEQDRFL